MTPVLDYKFQASLVIQRLFRTHGIKLVKPIATARYEKLSREIKSDKDYEQLALWKCVNELV